MDNILLRDSKFPGKDFIPGQEVIIEINLAKRIIYRKCPNSSSWGWRFRM